MMERKRERREGAVRKCRPCTLHHDAPGQSRVVRVPVGVHERVGCSRVPQIV